SPHRTKAITGGRHPAGKGQENALKSNTFRYVRGKWVWTGLHRWPSALDGVVDAAARMVRQRYGMASHFVT
ncbi:MAG: hypothetical protein PHQ87_14140, partial [Hydrogenophaga sp.]|uniref:hypothetical protein n=1 Tax=Hydrogenophaga sp. TaxID=1904254 RepID=UPI00262A2EE6